MYQKQSLSKLDSYLRQQAIAHNAIQTKYSNFFRGTDPGYSPYYIPVEEIIDPNEILLGYLLDGQPFRVPYNILTSRSLAAVGKTRSGKTTLIIRLLWELLNKKPNIHVKIIDPEGDAFTFLTDERIQHIDLSEIRSSGERWNIAADIFEESLTRPLARDAPDMPHEVIVIEEAIEFCPEQNVGLGHLEPDERDALSRCITNIKCLARMGIKRKTILVLIFQSPFLISKAVLRQIGTLFVFRLSRNEVQKLSNFWLQQMQYDIEEAAQGLCHATGEGLPGLNTSAVFQVAQVDEFRTSDSR